MTQRRPPRYRGSATQSSQVRWSANTLHRLDLFALSPRDGLNRLYEARDASLHTTITHTLLGVVWCPGVCSPRDRVYH
jgi:hypothetical protein